LGKCFIDFAKFYSVVSFVVFDLFFVINFVFKPIYLSIFSFGNQQKDNPVGTGFSYVTDDSGYNNE